MATPGSADIVVSMSLLSKLLHLDYASAARDTPSCELGQFVVNGQTYTLYGSDDKGRSRKALSAAKGQPIAQVLGVTNILKAIEASKTKTMMLQELVTWDLYIRIPTIGRRWARAIRYDPAPLGMGGYNQDYDILPRDIRDKAEELSLNFNKALGYDMNSMEWAVRDGVPYAIDFMNPAPDMDVYSLTPHYFEWAVSRMADLAIRLAKTPHPAREPRRGEFLLGRRELDLVGRSEKEVDIPRAAARPAVSPALTPAPSKKRPSPSRESS